MYALLPTAAPYLGPNGTGAHIGWIEGWLMTPQDATKLTA